MKFSPEKPASEKPADFELPEFSEQESAALLVEKLQGVADSLVDSIEIGPMDIWDITPKIDNAVKELIAEPTKAQWVTAYRIVVARMGDAARRQDDQRVQKWIIASVVDLQKAIDKAQEGK